MFIVFLRFSDNKSRAGAFMEKHNEWIKQGFDQGIFLFTGSLQPRQGGMVLAHNTTFSELQHRVMDDPFVVENIVVAEVVEVAPGRVDERLAFLLSG